MALDICPHIHELLDGLGKLAMHNYATSGVAYKVALRKIIGNPSRMVHVAMSETNVVYRDDFAWCPANVKTDIVLWDGNNALLACEGETEDLRTTDLFLQKSTHDKYIKGKGASRPANRVK